MVDNFKEVAFSRHNGADSHVDSDYAAHTRAAQAQSSQNPSTELRKWTQIITLAKKLFPHNSSWERESQCSAME